MEKSKKVLQMMLAAALTVTPFVSIPKAYAISVDDVNADDTDETDTTSGYTINFTMDEDLDSGKYIYIDFGSDYDIDTDLDTNNVEVNGDEPDDVKVSGGEIKIKISNDISSDDDVEVVIDDDFITNPVDEDDYDVSVWTSTDSDEDSYTVSISDSGSSNNSDDFSVDVDDDEEDVETAYTLGRIDLDNDLQENDTITVTFPDSDMLPSNISDSDVQINNEDADNVDVNGDEVTFDVPSGADGDSHLDIEFTQDAGITNPSYGDDYTIKVDHEGDKYYSDTFEIVESSSSSSSADSDFGVSLSDNTAGARSSYSFEADFGSKKLYSDDEMTVEFPSSEMIPGDLSTSDITINGKTVKKVTTSGRNVYLTAPSSLSTTSDVRVAFNYSAWITNPKSSGSYQLSMTVDGKKITSRSFSISGAVTPTPVPQVPATPVVVNNSTATVALTKPTLNSQTGVNVGIKGVGVPLVRNRDFIEVVFPWGFRVPAYIAPGNVSVNGVAASYVAVRGNNLLVYPSQDIPAATAANVVIGQAANIVTPAAKNVYSISVFSSEEKGLLFARAVSVGGAPIVTPAPQAPQQPSVFIPSNAARVKLNVANFTLNGRTYPLSVAPYVVNSTTLVPAQFYKEALALTTQWNNYTVAIISGTKVLKFTVGSNQARVGNTIVTMPAPVQLKNGMPMLPMRFVADNLGYKLGVDAKTGIIFTYK